MHNPTQTFVNHKRQPSIGYMIVFLILVAEVIVRIINAIQQPSLMSGWAILVALAVAGVLYYARVNAQIVQDRSIMLEMRLRLARVLPSEQQADIQKLSKSQLIGLRFASDAELPALAGATLSESLSNKQIKQRVKDWQPDWQRV
jgi:hypothetical protein